MERKLIEYAGPIADALDAGLIPWAMRHLPRNVLTGKVYRRMNPLLLQVGASRFGFSSPLWGTRKDWEAVGSTLARPVTAGTRHWIYEDLVYYPWDRTDEDVAYNWDQTVGSYQPPKLTIGNSAGIVDRIVNKIGAQLSGKAVAHRIPGGVADYAAVAHDLMAWAERHLPTENGHLYHSPGLLRALRAEMGAGFLLAALGIEVPLPLCRAIDPRWAGLLRERPEVLPDLCELVSESLDLLLGKAGAKIPWHFFKVKVTRWCLPRGNHRPSVYSVRADDKVLGEVRREAGGRWKAGKWSGTHVRSRTLGNIKTKEAALAALLARSGIDKQTPIVDDSDIVSIPVSFGAWAGKRHFDYDTAYYLGDDEDGIFFLPEQGPDGRWHAVVIVSTSWGDSVLAIDGPHDGYVDACEAGLRAALDWLVPRQIRVADEEIEGIREAARSRSAAS